MKIVKYTELRGLNTEDTMTQSDWIICALIISQIASNRWANVG